MRVVIDNSALFSGKNGVYRYSECVINGLIEKLGCNSVKLFPAPKVLEFANNKEKFDISVQKQFDWYNLGLSAVFCRLKKEIEFINSTIAAAHPAKNQLTAKIKRELLRVVKHATESLFNEKKIIRGSLKGEQIYHCLYGYIPDEIKNIPNLKLCITVHDIIPILYPNLIEGGKHYCNAKETEQFKGLTGREIIFTVSEHSKNDLCNFNTQIDPLNVHVTHLAASQAFQRVTDSEIIEDTKTKYNIPKNTEYVLSTLSSDPKKNIPFVVNGFLDLLSSEKLGNLKLVLIGKKESLAGLPKDLCEKIEKHKEEIILTGFVEDEEVSILYSGALCFCFPSLYEGFGLPVLEAMQCGVPVITSNISSLPEIAGNAALLVDPNNEDDFKQNILNVYNDLALRKELSAMGIERAAQFSWNKCVDDMIEVYASIAG